MDPMADSVIVTTPHEGLTVITINRPHRRNAVDPLTAKRLYDAILAFEEDSSQKVCILTGSEGIFCAGADLHEVTQSNPNSPSNASYLQPVLGRNQAPMGPSRMQVKKPMIAAVA